MTRLPQQKPELLAPAGDFESLQMAIAFGADAVYLGAKEFSMRASAQNFTLPQLNEAVGYAHERGVRVHLACNTLPRNDEVRRLPAFLEEAALCGVDAFIVADPGVFALARRYAPGVAVHISTQVGVVNYAAASALYEQGASRVVLARELSLDEVRCLRRETPGGLALEAFVHGAMCVSFSGRCLLSNYLAARDANRGGCAQPCRWSYALMEEKRPGEFFPVYEDEQGTHILNARDLCMIEHLGELAEAGVQSFKIEGRAKSSCYTAAVVNAYRMAIDGLWQTGSFDPRLVLEVEKVSHRPYCTGFYFGPVQNGQVYDGANYERGWDFIAVVERCEGNLAYCRQRNRFSPGEQAELLEPGRHARPVKLGALYDENGAPLTQAAQPDGRVLLELPGPVAPFSLLRRKSPPGGTA